MQSRWRDEMVEGEPDTELSSFSSEGANPTSWAKGRADLQSAQVYWVSTVRPDGSPHVTPLLGIWLDGRSISAPGLTNAKQRTFRRTRTVSSRPAANELDGLALSYRVAPSTAFGFAKGEPFSQTRWPFPSAH